MNLSVAIRFLNGIDEIVECDGYKVQDQMLLLLWYRDEEQYNKARRQFKREVGFPLQHIRMYSISDVDDVNMTEENENTQADK